MTTSLSTTVDNTIRPWRNEDSINIEFDVDRRPLPISSMVPTTTASNYHYYRCHDDDDDDDDDDCNKTIESCTQENDDDDTVVGDNLTNSDTDPYRDRELYGVGANRRHSGYRGGLSPWCYVVGWTMIMMMINRHHWMLVLSDGGDKNSVFQQKVIIPNIEDVYLESPFILRINCGSSDVYLDNDKNIWFPDTSGSTNGNSNGIRNTNLFTVSSLDPEDDTVTLNAQPMVVPVGTEGSGFYNVERQFITQGQYDIVVPWNNGDYRVELYFVETRRKPRFFEVYMENELMVAEYNILHAANNRLYTATVLNYTVHVMDDVLSIQFISHSSNDMLPAKISGIQVSSI